jgi:signal transduction histidine kinase/PAS domain-containing protein
MKAESVSLSTAQVMAVSREGSDETRMLGLEATIRRRDAVLAAISHASSRFLRTADWDHDIREVLAALGNAAEVSRVYLFEGHRDIRGSLCARMRNEWAAEGIAPLAAVTKLQDIDLAAVGLARWEDLTAGDVIHGPLSSLRPSEREFLAKFGVRSIATVPVFTGETWWGFVGFTDDLTEREWSRSLLETLRAAAATVGAAIYRKSAETELRRRETQLADAQSIAHMGSWDWDIETNSLVGSDEMYRIYGFEEGKPITTGTILERVHPDDAEIVRHAIDGAVRLGNNFSVEHRVIRAPDDIRLLRAEGRVVLNADGVTKRIIGAGHDITERRKSEDEIRRRDEQLAEAQAIAHVGTFVWDIPRDEFSGSDELYRIFGFEPDHALRPESIVARVHPDDTIRVQDVIRGCFATGTSFNVEYRITRTPDDIRLFHSEGHVSKDAAGALSQILGFVRDITDERAAEADARLLIHEQAARSSAEAGERRAEFLAKASLVLGSSFDYATTLASLARLAVPELADFCTVELFANQVTGRVVTVSHKDPAMEQTLAEVNANAKECAPWIAKMRDAVARGQSAWVTEITDAMLDESYPDPELTRRLKALRPHSFMVVPIFVDGSVAGDLGLYLSDSGRRYEMKDVKLLEELARCASAAVENARLYRLAEQATRARDQMLGVVVHDLRNPLGTIIMASSFLEETLEAEAPARRFVAMVHRAGDRMNRLIGDLLDVKRMENGKLHVDPKPLRAAVILMEAAEMLRPLAAAEGLELSVDMRSELPLVAADAHRTQQVLSNLVGNAIKFTPKGGRITLRGLAVEQHVRFAVSDTGPGIPAEQLPHIFGQFWQGKRADRRGIGLGLGIAKGIVEAHEGTIWAESTVGQGTTFYFTLPVTEA